MIIKRKQKPLYYISSNPNLEKEIVSPDLPNNFLTREKFQDNKTKRIRLYNTIEDALGGLFLGQNLKDSKLFVYTPLTLDKESLLGPRDLSSIPYYNCVDELWYLKSCRFKLVGEIKVESIKKTKTYHYGPRQTIGNVYIWNWKEILKPWERKKIDKLN